MFSAPFDFYASGGDISGQNTFRISDLKVSGSKLEAKMTR